MGGTGVIYVVPYHRRGLAQHAPVLSSFIVDAHDLGFDMAEA